MKVSRWAIIVTLLYALVLALLLLPVLGALADDSSGFSFFERYLDALVSSTADVGEDPEGWTVYWIGVGTLVLCQALLLFVTVDGGLRQRRTPRQHLFFSVAAATISIGILTLAAFWSALMAVFGDDALVSDAALLLSPLVFWLIWAVVFYIYRHRLSQGIERLVGWLLKGSILELLIAVPAHIVTRQREDCCAPLVTLAGIASGLAIMFMAFGPGVILLYRRRIGEKRRLETTSSEESNATDS